MGETQKLCTNKVFLKPCEKAEEWRKNDNKFIALLDEHEIEEKDEDKTNKNCDELKTKKIKGVKNNKMQVKTSGKKFVNKAIESL